MYVCTFVYIYTYVFTHVCVSSPEEDAVLESWSSSVEVVLTGLLSRCGRPITLHRCWEETDTCSTASLTSWYLYVCSQEQTCIYNILLHTSHTCTCTCVQCIVLVHVHGTLYNENEHIYIGSLCTCTCTGYMYVHTRECRLIQEGVREEGRKVLPASHSIPSSSPHVAHPLP